MAAMLRRVQWDRSVALYGRRLPDQRHRRERGGRLMPRRHRRRSNPSGLRLMILTITMLCLGVGCVERRYIVRAADPSGRPVNARVTINSTPAGISPVSINYEYYGTRRVKIEAEGFETVNTTLPIRAPIWDNAVTGFFTENLIPITLRDEREFTFQLKPTVNPPIGDLIGRGEALRQQAQGAPPPEPPRFFRFFAL